jgi:hypothetical protein
VPVLEWGATVLRRWRHPAAPAPAPGRERWIPAGEPYRTWDAAVAQDDGCAGGQAFAVRWLRPGVPSAAIVICFYAAYGGPADADGYVIGCAWQQRAAAAAAGGGVWVYTGWDTLAAGLGSTGRSSLDEAAELAQRCAAYYSTGPLPRLTRAIFDPFDWDGAPDCPGYGRPFPAWGAP